MALERSLKTKQRCVWFTCRNFGRGGYKCMEKEKKKNCRPLAAERLAAAMFFFFFWSLVLGPSERRWFTWRWDLPSARILLSLS